MAYIFVKDKEFLPFDNLGDNRVFLSQSSNCFSVDTLLAYPVSILNNKGYMTLQCCEGHPLEDVQYELAEDYKQRKNYDLSDTDKIFAIQNDENEIKYICFRGKPNTGAHVIFEKNIILPTTPCGWTYRKDDNSIRWDTESYSNPTDYYKKLIVAIDYLTNWVENLDAL